MSRNDSANFDRDGLLERATRIVRDVVMSYRRRGAKKADAMADAARDLDVTPRRIRAIFNREGLTRVLPGEHARLVDRFLLHLDREMAELDRWGDALMQKKIELRRGLIDEQQSVTRQCGNGTGSRSRNTQRSEDVSR